MFYYSKTDTGPPGCGSAAESGVGGGACERRPDLSGLLSELIGAKADAVAGEHDLRCFGGRQFYFSFMDLRLRSDREEDEEERGACQAGPDAT